MNNKQKATVKWIGSILLGVILKELLGRSGAIDYVIALFHSPRLFMFLSAPVTVGNVIVFGALFTISYILISAVFQKLLKKSDVHSKTKQQLFYETFDAFKVMNQYNTIAERDDIEFQTDINAAGITLRINSLYPFCAMHDERKRMMPDGTDFYKCHVLSCKNSIDHNAIKKAETEILSDLENKWDKLGVDIWY